MEEQWATLEHSLVESSGECEKLDDVAVTTDEFWIGRLPKTRKDEGCNLVLKETVISSKHLKLWRERDAKNDWVYFVMDSSSNGTWLGQNKLEKKKTQQLNKGDVLSLARNAKTNASSSYHEFTFVPLRESEVGHGSAENDAGNLKRSNSSRSKKRSRKQSSNSEADPTPASASQEQASKRRKEKFEEGNSLIETMSKLRQEFEASEKALKLSHEKELERLRHEKKDIEDEKVQLNEKVSLLRSELAEIQEQVNSIKAETNKKCADLENSLVEKRNELSKKDLEHNREKSTFQNEIDDLKRQLRQSTVELEEKKIEVAKVRTNLDQTTRAFHDYKEENPSTLKSKLNGRLVEAGETVKYLKARLHTVGGDAKEVKERLQDFSTSVVDRMNSMLKEMMSHVEENLVRIDNVCTSEGQLEELVIQKSKEKTQQPTSNERIFVDTEDDYLPTQQEQHEHSESEEDVKRREGASSSKPVIPSTVMEEDEERETEQTDMEKVEEGEEGSDDDEEEDGGSESGGGSTGQNDTRQTLGTHQYEGKGVQLIGPTLDEDAEEVFAVQPTRAASLGVQSISSSHQPMTIDEGLLENEEEEEEENEEEDESGDERNDDERDEDDDGNGATYVEEDPAAHEQVRLDSSFEDEEESFVSKKKETKGPVLHSKQKFATNKGKNQDSPETESSSDEDDQVQHW